MGQKQKIELQLKRINHAKYRFKQRHGVYLGNHEYFQLINDIIDGRSQFVLRMSNHYTMHRVNIDGTWYPVIYNSRSKVIITVYYSKWIKKQKDGTYWIRERHVKTKKVNKRQKQQWQAFAKVSKSYKRRGNLNLAKEYEMGNK